MNSVNTNTVPVSCNTATPPNVEISTPTSQSLSQSLPHSVGASSAVDYASWTTADGKPCFDDYSDALAVDFSDSTAPVPLNLPPQINKGRNSHSADVTPPPQPQFTLLDWVGMSVPTDNALGRLNAESQGMTVLKSEYKRFCRRVLALVNLKLGKELAGGRVRCMYGMKTKEGRVLKGSAIGFGGMGCIWFRFSGAASNIIGLTEGGALKLETLVSSLGGRFTRIDTALDCYAGEFTPVSARRLYRKDKKQFTAGGRGRHPKATPYFKEDRGKLTGFVVGGDGGLKRLTMYDKWEEGKSTDVGHNRAEVSQRNSCRRELPSDSLTNRDAYFAGAYLFTATLLKAALLSTGCTTVPAAVSIITNAQKERDRTLWDMEKHLRHQYGKTINALMLYKYDEDATALVLNARRVGLPERLTDCCAVLEAAEAQTVAMMAQVV